jgi:hypothetical protein
MPFKALIAVLLFVSGAISAQSTPPRPDELKRTTPRSSIYNFLDACHQGKFVLASGYLDLRGIRAAQRTVKGSELAKQLEALLDRDPRFEVQRLSDSPDGNREDALAPDRETLVTLQLNGSPVTLDLQRVTQQDTSVWLVSQQSVELIPELATLAGESGPNAISRNAALVLARDGSSGVDPFHALTLALANCDQAAETARQTLYVRLTYASLRNACRAIAVVGLRECFSRSAGIYIDLGAPAPLSFEAVDIAVHAGRRRPRDAYCRSDFRSISVADEYTGAGSFLFRSAARRPFCQNLYFLYCDSFSARRLGI